MSKRERGRASAGIVRPGVQSFIHFSGRPLQKGSKLIPQIHAHTHTTKFGQSVCRPNPLERQVKQKETPSTKIHSPSRESGVGSRELEVESSSQEPADCCLGKSNQNQVISP